MARITSIEKRDKERYSKQEAVPALYCVFEKEGVKYFQIDTYGNQDREYSFQPSQYIQFDREFAKQLDSILTEEFDL
jgi:hypothetical protein